MSQSNIKIFTNLTLTNGFWWVRFTHGTIPSFLGNLSFLLSFIQHYNNLGGIIPNSFGRLTKLKFFLTASNRLFGTIPPSILNLSSLIAFDVGINQIQGCLPSNMGVITLYQILKSFPLARTNLLDLSLYQYLMCHI